MQLSGNFEDLGLGEILQILSFSSKSGVLSLRTTKDSGMIVFQSGSVVKASSTQVTHGIGEVLAKKGLITREQLDKAKAIQKQRTYSETIADILSGDLGVAPEKIESIGKKYIEKIVSSFFLWHDGCFVFELKEYRETSEIIQKDPLQFVLGKGINPQHLAMEGLRLLDESTRTKPSAPVQAVREDHAPEEKTGQEGAPDKEPVKDTQGPDPSTCTGGQEPQFDGGDDARAPRVQESRGLRILREMLEELSRPLALNEIVLLILRFSSEIINRSVVFSVKNGSIHGFGQFGIEIPGVSPDQRVREMSIPPDQPSILKDALDNRGIVAKELERSPWNDYIIERLGGHRPVEAFATPIMVSDKAAMILYGDNAPEGRKIDELSALEIFLENTSKAIERLVMEKKKTV